MVWKCLYPVGIHFGISQIISYLGVYLLVQRTGGDMSAYYQHVLMLTGLTGILAAIPCLLLYRGDFLRRKETGILHSAAVKPPMIKTESEYAPEKINDGVRSSRKISITGSRLHIPEILGFLITGAFLGQYGNILVGLFQQYLNPETYQETQTLISEGKSIWSLIFWMGIVAPFAEEIIFRWLVFLRMRDNLRVVTAALLSGLTFGIYHMNLIQGVYATIMGLLFALILEWRGNLFASVLLHMGANIWSLLVSDVMLYMLDHTGATSVIALNLLLVFAGTYGIWRCYKNYRKRGCTRLI